MPEATAPQLIPQTVGEIFTDCLFDEGKIGKLMIPAYGVLTNVGFDPEKIDKHRDEVAALLEQLPEEFQESGGGGMSFLRACQDKDGNQWTGLHAVMEQLFLLGMATGKAKCLMPRDMWAMLPGGMPYYVVLTEAQPVEPEETPKDLNGKEQE